MDLFLSTECLYLIKGLETKGKVLTSQCGKNKKKEVLVKTSKPFSIRFRSDNFFPKKGFSYQIIPEPKCEYSNFVADIYYNKF